MHESEVTLPDSASSRIEAYRIRPVRNDDADSIIGLVARCFADYPNCILDVEREEPELKSPADSFERMWVAETGSGDIVGMIGLATRSCADLAPIVELRKLYIDHRARGHGLARRLVELVETHASRVGARAIELWSDTRFDKAHRVYAHFGYPMQTAIRDLHDLSNTREYYFLKAL